MKMTKKQATRKYGNNKIMTIPKYSVDYLIKQRIDTKFVIPFFDENMKAALRSEAEFDASHPQVIPYVVLLANKPDIDGNPHLHVYTTHRIGGDTRLVGKYSIGTGGHIEEAETVMKAIARELKEEVGLPIEKCIDANGNSGSFSYMSTADQSLIYDETSEVNSVHVGLILCCHVEDPDCVKVREPKKLEGEWVEVDDLFNVLDANCMLEDWSRIAAHRMFPDIAAAVSIVVEPIEAQPANEEE